MSDKLENMSSAAGVPALEDSGPAPVSEAVENAGDEREEDMLMSSEATVVDDGGVIEDEDTEVSETPFHAAPVASESVSLEGEEILDEDGAEASQSAPEPAQREEDTQTSQEVRVSRRELRAAREDASRERELRNRKRQTALSAYSALEDAKRRGVIMHGKIVGVEELERGDDTIVGAVILLNGTTKVTIPFEEFYISNPLDMRSVDLTTVSGRRNYLHRQRQFMDKLIGLDVNFCINDLYRGENTDDDTILVLGSRAAANLRIQQMVFGGRNPRIKAGGFYDAIITSVSENGVAICLGGIDISVPKFALTNRYLLSLKSYYNVGDTVRVKVVSVDNTGDTVKVVVDPKAAELAEGMNRYGLLKPRTSVIGTITRIYRIQNANDERINIYAWIEGWDLPCKVTYISATEFGREPIQGDTLRLTIRGYGASGYLIASCNGNYGNASLFNRA